MPPADTTPPTVQISNTTPRVVSADGFTVETEVRFRWSEPVTGFSASDADRDVTVDNGASIVPGTLRDYSDRLGANTWAMTVRLDAAGGRFSTNVVVRAQAVTDQARNLNGTVPAYATKLDPPGNEGIGSDGSGASAGSEGGNPAPIPKPFRATAARQGSQLLLRWVAAEPNQNSNGALNPVRFYLIVYRDKNDSPGCSGTWPPAGAQYYDWVGLQERPASGSGSIEIDGERRKYVTVGKRAENELAFRKTCHFNTVIPAQAGRPSDFGSPSYSVLVPAQPADRVYRVRACNAVGDAATAVSGYTGCRDSQEFRASDGALATFSDDAVDIGALAFCPRPYLSDGFEVTASLGVLPAEKIGSPPADAYQWVLAPQLSPYRRVSEPTDRVPSRPGGCGF